MLTSKNNNPIPDGPLRPEELQRLDDYWRATLYLCAGMIYLQDRSAKPTPSTSKYGNPHIEGDSRSPFSFVPIPLIPPTNALLP
jgi:hypothetical protein